MAKIASGLPSTKKLVLGIDIGGTKIRGVIFDDKKVRKLEERLYEKKPPNKKVFLKTLFGVIDALIEEPRKNYFSGIGIGTAGIVAEDKIFPGTNLKVVGQINLAELLKRKYGLSSRIDNDVKTAALAEYRFGAGRGAKLMFMLTLGTGVGGAYIKDGILQRGSFDSAYEAGFIIIDAERARKGKRGDFEWFCSEKFFKSRNLNPNAAREKGMAGDKKLRAFWKGYGEYLGIGIASIINLIEPEMIVVGGGISDAWPLFAATMRKTAKRLIVSPRARLKTKIVRAKLGKNAGAIGAALLLASQKNNGRHETAEHE